MKLTEVKSSDNELRAMLESGLILREAGRLTEAEKIFRGVHELVPQSDVPLVALSSIAVRREDFDEALRLCDEALRHNPESLFTRVNRAEVLLYQQKIEAAESELHEIMRLDPDSPHSRTARALLEALKLSVSSV